MAPGMFLAHRVVPSSGSTAISTLWPPLPTFSPMNSIGASSRSPSPITIVPSIGSLFISRRMASTAAWSASFSLPRPRSRAAATAARSVTRTISIDRMRSSMVAVFPDAGLPWLDDISLRSSGQSPAGTRRVSLAHVLIGEPVTTSPGHALVLFDADDLRIVRNDTLFPDRLQGAPHRILARRISDEDHGRRRVRASRIVAAVRPRAAMALHDRFERDLLVGEQPRDRRKCSRTIDRGKSTRLNSSHLGISYAVFCLKQKKHIDQHI